MGDADYKSGMDTSIVARARRDPVVFRQVVVELLTSINDSLLKLTGSVASPYVRQLVVDEPEAVPQVEAAPEPARRGRPPKAVVVEETAAVDADSMESIIDGLAGESDTEPEQEE
jgi:hypothetical protein